MFLHLVRAEHIRDHRLHLWFNDGFDGEIDLSTALTGPIFQPLQDVEVFKNFRIEGHTLSWTNGADFAPEYLRQHAKALSPA